MSGNTSDAVPSSNLRQKPNHSQDAIDLAYWSDRNFCEVEGVSILRHAAAVTEGRARLRADQEVDRLHREGVDWRRKRISALVLESDSFYMLARLMQMPPTRVLPLEQQSQLLTRLMRMRQLQMARKAEDESEGRAPEN